MKSLSRVIKDRGLQTSVAAREIPVIQPVQDIRLQVSATRHSDSEDSRTDERTTESAEQRAAEILERARIEADRIRQNAEAEAQTLRLEAQTSGAKQGFDAGYQSGNALCHKEWQSKVEELERVATRLSQARTQWLRERADFLSRLAEVCVKRVLERELQLAPVDISAMVSRVLTYVLESTQVEIRVHPTEFQTALDAHPTWRHQKFGEWDLVVIPDYAIEPGGCVLRSDLGRVDARMETRIELIEEAIHSLLERSEFDDSELGT